MAMTNKISRRYGKIWLLPFVAVAVGMSLSSPVKSQPQLLMSGIPGQEKFYNHDVLTSHYTENGMKPIWIRGQGAFQPRAEAVVKILEESWTHGLNPTNYKIDEIRILLQSISSKNKMELDLLLSDAVIRYMHDLSSMRGQSMSADAKVKYWRDPISKADILTMVADSADPIAKVREMEPSYALYQSLRKELMHLAALPRDESKPVVTRQSLKPGKSYSQIPAIRAKMGMPAVEKNPEFYDEALAVEVIKIQRSYGIETDGVIGGHTLELINLTNDDKMMQIIANMERLRWINQGRPDRYILVNIPSASLWAVDDGKVALTMPVIVGKTARPTYSFKTEITGVRFNPNWTVPPTIKSKDFLPMLQQDPNALSRKGIKLTYNGRTIDPAAVDWSTVSSREIHRINMVQSPGDDNPLGKVRVIMENPYNIYLHDTNHREMFDKKERNLSSGCIRVSDPEKLADFILDKNQDWSDDSVRKYIDSGRMRDIKTDETIPVYITYQTVWLDTEGRLVYGRDVYGQDRKLVEILKKASAIHIPEIAPKDEISL